MRHLRALCLSFLTLAATAGTFVFSARAADPPAAPAVDDAASKRADELTHQGNDFALKLRWKDAEPLFRQAWALKRSYDIGGNLGLAELALGKYRDAAEHLSFALKTFPANGKGPHRYLLQESFGKAKGRVAMITVEVSQKGALVVVDGKEVGRSPLADDVFVEPGAHAVEARLAEFTDAKQTVEATKGGAQTVKLELSKARPVPAATASAGPPVLPPKDDPRARMKKGIIIAGGVLAAGGLAVGIGLTVAANGKGSDEDVLGAKVGGRSACFGQPAADVAADCAALRSAASSRGRLSNAAVGSFITAGVLALGTAGLAVWTASSRRGGTTVRAAPVVGSGHRGIAIEGTW